jgi:hypothetical protein
MRKGKRLISKTKTYGFNPFVDQVDAISQIMEATGAKAESEVLRKLIDEALQARRKKAPLVESESSGGVTLPTLQTLLQKLIRQGETSLRIQDVSLALLQDTLAEASAGRQASWSLVVTALEQKGLTPDAIQDLFDKQGAEAKNHAYGIAEEIKETQNAK